MLPEPWLLIPLEPRRLSNQSMCSHQQRILGSLRPHVVLRPWRPGHHLQYILEHEQSRSIGSFDCRASLWNNMSGAIRKGAGRRDEMYTTSQQRVFCGNPRPHTWQRRKPSRQEQHQRQQRRRQRKQQDQMHYTRHGESRRDSRHGYENMTDDHPPDIKC